MRQPRKVLITGAGGFIGHHLGKYLVAHGYWVRGVDIQAPEFEPTAAHEFERLDLRRSENALRAARCIDEVYALAANAGGIGLIESSKAVTVRDNTLIDLQTIEAVAGKTIQKRYGLDHTYRWIAGQIQNTRATALEAVAAAV
jgi:nucleoside-diphosphate-sugar epimerase